MTMNDTLPESLSSSEHPVAHIEETLQFMIDALVRCNSRDKEKEGVPDGWWILACGDQLDHDSFSQREWARECLLHEVRSKGLAVNENIWIWDETNVVQLVIHSTSCRRRAEKKALTLRGKGLRIRIVPRGHPCP